MSVGSLANMAVAEGEYERAMAGYEGARAMLQALGDKGRLAQVVANMGSVANIERRFELARSLGEEALALQPELGNSEAATISLHNLARIDLRTGRLAAAADLFRQCLESARELAYPELVAYCLQGSSEIAATGDDPDRAARLLEAADAMFAELGVIRLGDEAESYEETLKTLEAQLGERALEEARAGGRAATLDEAVAEALELLDAAQRERDRHRRPHAELGWDVRQPGHAGLPGRQPLLPRRRDVRVHGQPPDLHRQRRRGGAVRDHRGHGRVREGVG
jgi:tetratricopeptide (TPR) repeat protein